MIEYRRVYTTYDVYNAIIHQHWNVKSELCEVSVFESYTNIPENGVATVYTVWGLKNAEVALVGAETTYAMEDGEKVAGTRKSVYWLCAPYWEED